MCLKWNCTNVIDFNPIALSLAHRTDANMRGLFLAVSALFDLHFQPCRKRHAFAGRLLVPTKQSLDSGLERTFLRAQRGQTLGALSGRSRPLSEGGQFDPMWTARACQKCETVAG